MQLRTTGTTLAEAAGPSIGLWVHRLSDLDGRTGVGRYAIELSRALSEAPWDGVSPSARYQLLAGRERGDAPAGLRDLPIGRSWLPRRTLHLAWMGGRWPRYEQVGPTVDLIHVLFPSFPIATQARLVATIHDLFTLDHPEWYSSGERRSVSRSTRLLAAEAAQIICDSGAVRSQVIDRLGVEAERVQVVHPGVSAHWHREARSDGSRVEQRRGRNPFVVAVGAVTPRKNLRLVLQALAQVPGVDLVLAGPSDEAALPTMQLIEALGLRDRVRVTGRVADEALVDLVQGAEALVHPSLDEGFGFPPLEAMAAGTPAIVSGSGSLPEVAGDAGVVLPVDDPDAWAAAIEAVVRDPDHRAALVARGSRHVAKFTWASAAQKVATIHAEVLERR
jgi:glycosyltransferase involved in cell wall biosynthesis